MSLLKNQPSSLQKIHWLLGDTSKMPMVTSSGCKAFSQLIHIARRAASKHGTGLDSLTFD
jgi:hypothetical protein